MALYLHVRTGDFGFLVAADSVAQVIGSHKMPDTLPTARQRSIAAQFDWQQRKRKAVDCRTLFGLPPRPAGHAAVELIMITSTERTEDEMVPVLLIDSIVGLETVDEQAFQPFPANLGQVRRYFDAVVARPEGGQALPRWKANSTNGGDR